MGPRIREDKGGGELFGGKNWGWFQTSPYGLRVSMSDEGRGWVPASARTTGVGGECGRFANRPYEGLAPQYITGDHKGRPYEGRMAGWDRSWA